MLERNADSLDVRFPEELKRYLEELLHTRVHVRPFEGSRRLPFFIERAYTLHEARILGRRCVIAARFDKPDTPAIVARHIDMVRDAADATTVFATTALDARNRSRLIGQGVPFVVPGNQLYIPDLAIDLRERFRAPGRRRADSLSPVAQTVLFRHILHPDGNATTPSLLAERLRYSAMSVGRAFDELVSAGLAETVRRGRERRIRFKADGRRLLEEATPLLRSPVGSLKFVRGNVFDASLKSAGETALSQLTDLARPRIDAFAVAARDWKAISRTTGLVETDDDDDACTIETWFYDPAVLSDAHTVDVLSLYAQFRDHRDERVAMAADRLVENLP